MRRGVVLLLILVAISVVAPAVVLYYIKHPQKASENSNDSYKSIVQKSINKSSKNYGHKNTTPNDTSRWIYFRSELYRYSLKYPDNFQIIAGNKNLFQASSTDYHEQDGIVTEGAIAQVIATDNKNSFEDAWGGIEKNLININASLLSKENSSVDGQASYKIRLENPDGTTEIRYLTFKSPYSYKISMLIGQQSQAQMDDYEQILDDIISTFNF